MAQVYKTLSPEAVKTRTTTPLTTNQKNQVNTILGNFMTYFKAAHA